MKKPRYITSKPSIVADNHLDLQFTVNQADQVWVTDITYIRTYQGWLYLAVVIDLYSRMVVGWSMKPSLHRDIVLDALMMGLKRRQPKDEVLIHSDPLADSGLIKTAQGKEVNSPVMTGACLPAETGSR